MMTEFTSEHIEKMRYIVAGEPDSASVYIALQALYEIEHLQSRIAEVENNREHIEMLLCKAEERIAELEQELSLYTAKSGVDWSKVKEVVDQNEIKIFLSRLDEE